MSTELQFPDSRHNHSPRCCCPPGWIDQPDVPCPACPDHGELAPTVECPQCHQPAGRPHTDYCTLAIREEVFADPSHGRIDRDIQDQVDEMNPTSLGQRVAIENTLQNRRDQTSQPATRTSQPASTARDNEHHQWLHALDTTIPTEHRTTSVHWHEITRCTPTWCGATPEDGEV